MIWVSPNNTLGPYLTPSRFLACRWHRLHWSWVWKSAAARASARTWETLSLHRATGSLAVKAQGTHYGSSLFSPGLRWLGASPTSSANRDWISVHLECPAEHRVHPRGSEVSEEWKRLHVRKRPYLLYFVSTTLPRYHPNFTGTDTKLRAEATDQTI